MHLKQSARTHMLKRGVGRDQCRYVGNRCLVSAAVCPKESEGFVFRNRRIVESLN
jgi:hypothetical protein